VEDTVQLIANLLAWITRVLSRLKAKVPRIPLVVTMSNDDMLDYLVQDYMCGVTTLRQNMVRATVTTLLPVRKHDYGAFNDQGYEISDSVLDCRPSGPIVIQTFDFGYRPGGFGLFDMLDGDGGQVVKIVEGWASVVMTQDGGDGIQWFIGAENKELGWLLFPNTITEQWQSTVARLNKGRSPGATMWTFNPAFTRYKKIALTMTFKKDKSIPYMEMVDTIVSEHFDGENIVNSMAMERFVFVRGLGLTVWESWHRNPNTADVYALERLKHLPGLPEIDVDAPEGWHLADGRYWTNIITANPPVSVADFGWQAVSQVV